MLYRNIGYNFTIPFLAVKKNVADCGCNPHFNFCNMVYK